MAFMKRYLYIRFTAAEPENLLSKLISSGMEVQNVERIDALTLALKIERRHFETLRKTLHRNGSTFKIINREGLFWYVCELFRRPVLTVGVILFLLLSCTLPKRIFFINVCGNNTIPDKRILSEAEVCGIHFAAKAVDVRSENVKNLLLGQLPELQWVGVTTSGTVATIQVKERSTIAENTQKDDKVSSIVSARDGIIAEQIVYRGNPLFQVGQTVKAGDVLISGYTDLGIAVKAEQASGEVFAYTLRENQFVSLSPSITRGELRERHSCYMVRIGKKVINLCNHSGILDAGCVKIYSEEYCTLPGNFLLPVSVIKVEYQHYEYENPQAADIESFQWLRKFSRNYLNSQMIAGKILEEELRWDVSDNGCILLEKVYCREMIGQVKYEENIVRNAENN